MPQNIFYTFSIFLLQLTILLTFSGFSHPNHQSPCHCLWESPHCSQHLTDSINSSVSLPRGTWSKGGLLHCFCLPILKPLLLPVKNRCFLTASCPTPLIVAMTSPCSLSSLHSFYLLFSLLSQLRRASWHVLPHKYIFVFYLWDVPFLHHYRFKWSISRACNLGLIFNLECFLTLTCKTYF